MNRQLHQSLCDLLINKNFPVYSIKLLGGDCSIFLIAIDSNQLIKSYGKIHKVKNNFASTFSEQTSCTEMLQKCYSPKTHIFILYSCFRWIAKQNLCSTQLHSLRRLNAWWMHDKRTI